MEGMPRGVPPTSASPDSRRLHVEGEQKQTIRIYRRIDTITRNGDTPLHTLIAMQQKKVKRKKKKETGN
jgi:hypothetical protein